MLGRLLSPLQKISLLKSEIHTDNSADEIDDGYDLLMPDISCPAINKPLCIKEKAAYLRGIDTLTKTEPNITSDTLIEICCYKISKLGTTPFIMYALQKSDAETQHDTLRWPRFTKQDMCNDTVSSYAIQILKKNIPHDSHESIKMTYCGYKKTKDSVQIWINYMIDPLVEFNKILSQKNTTMWWATVSEIVNTRKVLHYNIQPYISRFFIKHPEFIYLHTSTGEIGETPAIFYLGSQYDQTLSLPIMGLPEELTDSDTGTCYKLSTYGSAMKSAFWSADYSEIKGRTICGMHGRHRHGGIIRYAVFLGKHTIFEKDPPASWKQHYHSISDGFDVYVADDKQCACLGVYYVNTSQNVTPSSVSNAIISCDKQSIPTFIK